MSYLFLSFARSPLCCCCCLVSMSRPTLYDRRDCSNPDVPVHHYLTICYLNSKLTIWVCSNSCPLSRWCYLTVSSSSMSFSFWLQSFPASGCFWMSQFFSSGGQSIRASASTLVLQHQSFQWIFRLISFRIDWFDLLAVQGTLKSLLQHHNLKELILQGTDFFMAQLSHPYMTTGKP